MSNQLTSEHFEALLRVEDFVFKGDVEMALKAARLLVLLLEEVPAERTGFEPADQETP
jgi:hypothetical protein